MASNVQNETLQLYNAIEIWCYPNTCFLGEGGSALVILGQHSKLGFVAIKCFTVGRMQTIALISRVREEVELIQRANHENIARVHGWTKWANNIGILTQYYEGGDLGGILQMAQRVLQPLLCLRIALETATSLAFAHDFSSDKRIIHGDVKPENVLLSSDMRCKLADFGAAKLTSFTRTTIITVHRVSQGLKKKLTMSYASPEVLINPGLPPKQNQDSYSYGVLLYTLIAGQQPYITFNNDLAIKDAVTKGQRPDCEVIEGYKRTLSTEEREIIDHLQRIMVECWKQDPLQRPKMATVRDKLQQQFSKYNPTLAAQQAIEAFKTLKLDAAAQEEGKRFSLNQFSSRTGTFLPVQPQTGDIASLNLSSTTLSVTPATSSSSSHKSVVFASTNTESTSSQPLLDTDSTASSTPTQGGHKTSMEHFFDSEKRETALTLIRKHVSSVSENKAIQAIRIASDLQNISQGEAEEFRKFGEKQRATGYLESILFFHISSIISANDPDPKKAKEGIMLCAAQLRETNKQIIESDDTMKPIVRNHVLPLMRDMLLQINEHQTADEKFRVRISAWCLHYIEYSEGLIDDVESRERSLRKAISTMEETFGGDAAKCQVYASCLNNLGAVCSQTSRVKWAVKYFEQALKAYKQAEDFSSEDERMKDLETTESNLRRNRAKLGM